MARTTSRNPLSGRAVLDGGCLCAGDGAEELLRRARKGETPTARWPPPPDLVPYRLPAETSTQGSMRRRSPSRSRTPGSFPLRSGRCRWAERRWWREPVLGVACARTETADGPAGSALDEVGRRTWRARRQGLGPGGDFLRRCSLLSNQSRVRWVFCFLIITS
jgi:hypothetical protein